jgi:hypothetical protein
MERLTWVIGNNGEYYPHSRHHFKKWFNIQWNRPGGSGLFFTPYNMWDDVSSPPIHPPSKLVFFRQTHQFSELFKGMSIFERLMTKMVVHGWLTVETKDFDNWVECVGCNPVPWFGFEICSSVRRMVERRTAWLARKVHWIDWNWYVSWWVLHRKLLNCVSAFWETV